MSKTVVLTDKNGDQLYPATTADQVMFDDTKSIKQMVGDKYLARNVTGFQYSDIASIQDEDHHIAFPAIIYYSGTYFLAYRKASSHTSYDGEIVVKSGSAIDSLNTSNTILVSGEDCRDPKFVVFNSTLYMFFTTRESGSNNRVYYCTYNGSWNNPARVAFTGLSSVFCGGKPIVYNSNIYIPIYSGVSCYLAYGTSLSNLSVRKVTSNGNECAVVYSGSEFVCIVRHSTNDRNGIVVRITNMGDPSTDKVTDIGFNCHCPEALILNNQIVLCYRSDVSAINYNNFYGELNVCIMALNGEVLNTFYNLFAGNNTDIGYASMIIVSGNLYVAYYLNFCHRIMIMKQSTAKIDDMQGVDAVYRIASLVYPTTPKGYQYKYPFGVRSMSGFSIAVPSAVEATIKNNHVWWNNTSSNPTKFYVYNDSSQSTLTSVISAIAVWCRHYLVADYNDWNDDAGKITEL